MDKGSFTYSALGWGHLFIKSDGVVVQSVYEGTEKIPSPQDWQEFWELAERIGAWNWNGDYSEYNLSDGGLWGFEMTKGSKQMGCSGDTRGRPEGFSELYRRILEMSGFEFSANEPDVGR